VGGNCKGGDYKGEGKVQHGVLDDKMSEGMNAYYGA
jgi:hypothetical protein